MDPSEVWLRDWHDRRSGATSRAFLRAKPSSYEWIAAHALPGDRVLDLACGDGALLELLRKRGIEHVAGIDLSEGELALARKRLGPDVPLVQGRAQELPFADGSYDRVTCHLALMLMRPVDEVLREVWRALRPGGSFVAIVGSGQSLDGGPNAWTMLAERLRLEAFSGPSIGDRRCYNEEGLRTLLSDFGEMQIERFVVDLSGTPDDIAALVHETYDMDRMTPDRVTQLEKVLRLDWQTIQRADGTLPCFFSVLGIRATR
jgi:ubiquinone/menaquinone biosynthesis C-methylase UbiE